MKKVEDINENHLQDVVDKNDKIIGTTTKTKKFENELITRNVVAFITDGSGKFITVKRSALKKSFPNLLDLAACGHVQHGESYQDAIKREIKEELDIVCEVELLKKIYHEHNEHGKAVKYFTSLFIGRTHKKVKTNNEVSLMPSLSFQELDCKINHQPELFTPFYIDEFKDVYDLLKEANYTRRTMMKEVDVEKAMKYRHPEIVVNVVTKSKAGKIDITPIGWATQGSSAPQTWAIAIGKQSFTHKAILETKEFTVCIPSFLQKKDTLYCGSVSAFNVDKLPQTKFKLIKAKMVSTPLIDESLACFECKMIKKMETSDSTIFLGEIISASISGKHDGIINVDHNNLTKVSRGNDA